MLRSWRMLPFTSFPEVKNVQQYLVMFGIQYRIGSILGVAIEAYVSDAEFGTIVKDLL